MDKVQKIREEVARIQLYSQSEVLKQILDFIDSLQEEPVSENFEKALASEWKGYVDRGAEIVDALEDNTQELAFAKGFYRAWNYPKQLPVSENLEEAASLNLKNFQKELTWEDIKTIDRLLNKCVDYSNPYQEVLKRFLKERKEK